MEEAVNTHFFSDKSFVEDVLDGMYDWVRVIDKNNNIIFLNKAMSQAIPCLPGSKCYTALGKERPCDNCISRKAIFEGRVHHKEEVIGDKVFSVMSSPLKNDYGQIVAAVEVLRDVTEIKKLQDKILEQNKKLQKDLNTAKKLQRSLLPWDYKNSKLHFSFFYHPSEDLGGDFLDIFDIDSNHIGIYIADVSGHGVSASMLTVFLQSSINKTELSPSLALEKLFVDFNQAGIFKNLYTTVFYGIFDLKAKTLTYSNAGHNVVPVIYNKDRFTLLNSPGIPISNWVESPDYIDRQIHLQKGDRLFLYTDGIIDARNPEGEQFGEDRVLEILLKYSQSPKETLDKISDALKKFAGMGNNPVFIDDITASVVEIR